MGRSDDEEAEESLNDQRSSHVQVCKRDPHDGGGARSDRQAQREISTRATGGRGLSGYHVPYRRGTRFLPMVIRKKSMKT